MNILEKIEDCVAYYMDKKGESPEYVLITKEQQVWLAAEMRDMGSKKTQLLTPKELRVNGKTDVKLCVLHNDVQGNFPIAFRG